MVFTTLALLQLGHALAVRSERQSLMSLGLMSNPWLLSAVVVGVASQLAIIFVPALHGMFGTRGLGLGELAVVALASPAVLVAVELEKAWWRRRAC
jgi:Ca2+-transporting ATPase